MSVGPLVTVDPAGVAQRVGADGHGIVWAVVATGIQGTHPHFRRHANLSLPSPLLHCDFTPQLNGGEAEGTSTPELLSEEALIDVQGHGTSVAGIIAGVSDVSDAGIEWELDESWSGIAPRCTLLSLKVLDDDGRGDEWTILAALSYVLETNARAGARMIHGVVLPLNLDADLSNYACGQTPVCERVEALVESGVVVVAAAGNGGANGLVTISDPGNAEAAITVGSTHGRRPQAHGASYFSSRGPTADGRLKPDLLAPGEKILTPAPPARNSRPGTGARRGTRPSRPVAHYQTLDGTSLAAAHVAGVAAALLSARPALSGRPLEVKKLLMQAATDLGRERYFQGCGLVNLSRALDQEARAEADTPAAEPPAPAVPPQSPSAVLPVVAGGLTVATASAVRGKRFEVSFSYAGEHDDYVRGVWKALRDIGRLSRRRIFYHKQFEAELSRPDLDLYLQDIYLNDTELLVVFLSQSYERKQWTGLEWRVVREIIKQRQSHAVMPIRFDETQIPGLFSLDGYSSAVGRQPEEIAELILDRLELNRASGLPY